MRYHFASIDSTNTWAKQNHPLFAKNQITLVTADTQTAGRGRFNRKWESPAKQNIYATFSFFVPPAQYALLGNIPQVLALSVVELLTDMGFHPKLKWPNDVLIAEKKVAGILCETTRADSLLCIILGVGLNVNMPLQHLRTIDRPATSLLAESGLTYDVETIIEQLQQCFEKNLNTLLLKGFSPFLDLFRHYVFTDKKIQFHANNRIWEGKIHSINEDGSLNLQLQSGKIKRFLSGEMLF